MSKERTAPALALQLFGEILKKQPVLVDTNFVARDLVALRQAFPNDSEFATAILAISKEIVHACRRREKHGKKLAFELVGYRRAAFRSGVTDRADLRLVFRPVADEKTEILAFGHRHVPRAVYLAAKNRTE